MFQPTLFDPLQKENIAESLGRAIESMEPLPTQELTSFYGAGVYAIYYCGSFPQYLPISKNCRVPIYYVGKAVPKGARKGIDVGESLKSQALFNRLDDHRCSIEAASNLRIKDFKFRVIVLDSLWIPLAESLMIAKYSPVWNTELDGFGNHDPGKGRKDSKRSKWDTLHPGRAWANKLQDNPMSLEAICGAIEMHLA